MNDSKLPSLAHLRRRASAILLALVLLLPWIAQSQQPGSTASAPAQDEAASSVTAPGSADAKVTSVAPGERTKDLPGPLRVSDRLVIDVEGLASWLSSNNQSCRSLRLFLDEQPINNLQPDDCNVDAGRLSFELFRIDRANEPTWTNILAKRRNFTANVDVSVGFVGGASSGNRALPIPSDAEDVPLVLVKIDLAAMAAVALLGSLALFLYLMKRSNIVRDGGPEPPAGTRRPYSLSRMQTAFWFFLILWGYLFISILVSSNVDIPTTCLSLMGIAAGTFVGAELIDSPRRASKAAASQPGPASQGLIRDLLSDSAGIAFHRFQMSVWTLVLGGVFAIRVWNELAMPSFDPTLLGLMGISSGTYIGLKLPEESSKGG